MSVAKKYLLLVYLAQLEAILKLRYSEGELKMLKPTASKAISVYSKSLKMAEEIRQFYTDFLRIKPLLGIRGRGYKRLKKTMEEFI